MFNSSTLYSPFAPSGAWEVYMLEQEMLVVEAVCYPMQKTASNICQEKKKNSRTNKIILSYNTSFLNDDIQREKWKIAVRWATSPFFLTSPLFSGKVHSVTEMTVWDRNEALFLLHPHLYFILNTEWCMDHRTRGAEKKTKWQVAWFRQTRKTKQKTLSLICDLSKSNIH